MSAVPAMTAVPADTAERAIYLYCLARAECLPLVQALAAEQLAGVDERYPVAALEEAGAVAVIGEVDSGEFSDQNLQSLSWVGPRAFRHEAVVERIMGASTVLPVKFGTIFRSRASLLEFLGRHREDVARVLEHLSDKAEWSVKGYLVDAQARPVVAASDAAIVSRMATLPAAPGARYLQQKQLDVAIDAALRLWLAQASEYLGQSLAPHAVDTSELRCHAGTVTGRSERMVFNASFLVADAALAGFRTALALQQQAYAGTGLTLELRGPWPPYNFCPALTTGR